MKLHKIESKFDVGETVYFINIYGAVCEAVVDNIYIEIAKDTKLVLYKISWSKWNYNDKVEEERLFASEEETNNDF